MPARPEGGAGNETMTEAKTEPGSENTPPVNGAPGDVFEQSGRQAGKP